MDNLTPEKRRVSPLEKKLFEIFCLFLLALGLYGFSLNFIFGQFSLISIPISILGLISGVFYYASTSKNVFHPLRIPLVILLSAFVGYYWFFLGGYMGPMPFVSLLFGAISLIIIPRKYRVYCLVFLFVLLTALISIQYATNLVQQLKFTVFDFPFEILLFVYIILLAINYLKAQVDKERNLVLEQNRKLESLNQTLQANLKEKEEIIGELNNTRDQLINSEKMASLGKLTAGIAHELNNPLNYIGGSVGPIIKDLEELKELINTDKEQESKQIFEELDMLLGNVKQGTDRASKIIHRLVRQSPKEDAEAGTRSVFDISKMISSAIKMFQRANQEVIFRENLPDGLFVFGSLQELSQVVNNLVQNALQSQREGVVPQIIINGDIRDNSVILSFSDNGIGIPKSNLKHVFEPFFTTHSDGQASGLGLFISYGIIKKHSGEIRIDSDADGTTVTVFLPKYLSES